MSPVGLATQRKVCEKTPLIRSYTGFRWQLRVPADSHSQWCDTWHQPQELRLAQLRNEVVTPN